MNTSKKQLWLQPWVRSKNNRERGIECNLESEIQDTHQLSAAFEDIQLNVRKKSKIALWF